MHPRAFTLLGLLTIASGLGAAENPAATAPVVPATPPAAASPAPAQPARWELAGVLGIRETLTVRINDTVEKTGAWLRVGESFGPAKLVAADADTATLQVGNERTVLGLRIDGVAPGEATPMTATASTAATPTATPAPLPSTGDPEADAKRDQTIAEREARMLVSDLLEISMIQRKAYEDKQAEAAKAVAETSP
ncbi:MAG: hypothetical protein RL324_2071 [Verrucomicrobiota bacterium]|jgi:hypothetical protein